jgi:hypothetical protein
VTDGFCCLSRACIVHRARVAEEELELRSLRKSLKTELTAILTSTDKKDTLTADQQARLLTLAESDQERLELQQTIEGEKTPLFAPFIYKMHYFTKTGSGQT